MSNETTTAQPNNNKRRAVLGGITVAIAYVVQLASAKRGRLI